MRNTVIILVHIFFLLLYAANNVSASANIKDKDIFAIGSSSVSVINFISEKDFKRNVFIPYGVNKGGVVQVDNTTALDLYNKYQTGLILPGGKAVNMVIAYSGLGGRTSFNGAIANDKLGLFFYKNIRDYGVDVSLPQKLPQPTAINIVFITPDSEKTVLTSSKTSNNLTQQQVHYHNIKDFKLILLEASTWGDEGNSSRKSVLRAFKAAKKVGSLKGFILNDIYYINKYRNDFLELIANVDILFGSESEVKALFKENDFIKVIGELQKTGPLSIITKDFKVVVIITRDQVIEVPIELPSQENYINIANYEEVFNAVFLYEYLNGKELNESVKRAAGIVSGKEKYQKTNLSQK